MSRCKASEVLAVMQGWVGLSRSKGTHKVIIDTYNKHQPLARNYKVSYKDAYCATTISAAFIVKDAVDMLGGTECSVERFIDIFKKKGIWNEDGTITPKVGDIICYNWDKAVQPNDGAADHIGMVESVKGKTMVIVEGNINGDVGRRTIDVGNGYIRGYAIPDYLPEESETVVEEKKVASETAKAGQEYEVSEYVGPNFTTKVSGKIIPCNDILIREKPAFDVRNRWYKIQNGYVSAYRVVGWITDKKGSWFEREEHRYPKSEVATIDGKEYAFDKDGYLITSERVASEDGHIVY